MALAPVGISTYARLGHLTRTVEALRANTLAAQSELFVFSDAPRPGDESKVEEVRRYARQIEGFRQVHLVERRENSRVLNSRGGLRQMLESSGRAIFMEEDIVTSPSFLAFMNDALERYQDAPEVLSISGYCPPIGIPAGFHQDVFALPRFSGWGVGIWKDRFDAIDETLDRREVIRRFANPKEIFRFARGGWDMLSMLDDEINGRIDALDVKIFYQQHVKGQVTVYPVTSLVENAGHDGSGVHCGSTNRFDVDPCSASEYALDLPDRPVMDPEILARNCAFRSGSYRQRFRYLKKFVKGML